MSRHAERYPTGNAGGRELAPFPSTKQTCPVGDLYYALFRRKLTVGGIGMLEMLKHIRESGVELKGDLEFVNDWEYFTDGIIAAVSQQWFRLVVFVLTLFFQTRKTTTNNSPPPVRTPVCWRPSRRASSCGLATTTSWAQAGKRPICGPAIPAG